LPKRSVTQSFIHVFGHANIGTKLCKLFFSVIKIVNPNFTIKIYLHENTGTIPLILKSDWLIIYGFTSRSRIFHLYGDVTIASEGLQNLGLCSALRAFEQGGIFIVPHLLWHGTSVFQVSSKGPPRLVAPFDTRGDVEDLF
jgi:hypothetical protein